MQNVVENRFVIAGDYVNEIQAFGLQCVVTFLDGFCENWKLHEVADHAVPLRSHAGEDEPDGTFGSLMVLKKKECVLTTLVIFLK